MRTSLRTACLHLRSIGGDTHDTSAQPPTQGACLHPCKTALPQPPRCPARFRLPCSRRRHGFARPQPPLPLVPPVFSRSETPFFRLRMPHSPLAMPHCQQGMSRFTLAMAHCQRGMTRFQLAMPHCQEGMPHCQQGMPRFQLAMRHCQSEMTRCQRGMPHCQRGMRHCQQTAGPPKGPPPAFLMGLPQSHASPARPWPPGRSSNRRRPWPPRSSPRLRSAAWDR